MQFTIEIEPEKIKLLENALYYEGMIPCRKRLPNKEECKRHKGKFLIKDHRGEFLILSFDHEKGEWSYPGKVVSWTLLPES